MYYYCFKQPALVEDQLASLYQELEIEGESPDLHLSEGITSSSSSGDDQDKPSGSKKVSLRGKPVFMFD